VKRHPNSNGLLTWRNTIELTDVRWIQDKAGVLEREWSPGPVGQWSGDCPKLPFLAWYLATGGAIKLLHFDAIVNADHYMKQPGWHSAEKHNPSPPPVGAVVFYGKIDSNGKISKNQLGHEAISLGEGLVATTVGTDFHPKGPQDNAVMPFQAASRDPYLGYYLPP
jgi:hypothetical protein